MIILDGIKARASFVPRLQKVFAGGQGQRKATLAIVTVGEDAASEVYVRNKKKFGESLGVMVRVIALSADTSQDEIVSGIQTLNADATIDGIIVQSPVPAHIDFEIVSQAVAKEKDVDGLVLGSAFVPATARGILSLLSFYDIAIKGKEVVVMGRSKLVGAPTAKLLSDEGAYVTVCHSKTEDVPSFTRKADIIVVAIGKAELVGAEYFRHDKTQVVIDVGIHRGFSGLVGDVDFESVKDVVAGITPVPGGVGPMTVLSLFENLADAFENKK